MPLSEPIFRFSSFLVDCYVTVRDVHLVNLSINLRSVIVDYYFSIGVGFVCHFNRTLLRGVNDINFITLSSKALLVIKGYFFDVVDNYYVGVIVKHLLESSDFMGMIFVIEGVRNFSVRLLDFTDRFGLVTRISIFLLFNHILDEVYLTVVRFISVMHFVLVVYFYFN